MTPYGRKPHANQYGSRRCREELHPVVAGRAQVQRETSAAFEEALDEMMDDDDPAYCAACDGPCCGLADMQGWCDCAERRRALANPGNKP